MTTCEKKIYIYLNKQGVSCSLNGFRYFVTAILYSLENPSASLNDICAHTAAHHNTTGKKVHRAMCYVLKDQNITPKKFIRGAAVAVQLEENDCPNSQS